jgi:predicted amidophosphoribosyltransferase
VPDPFREPSFFRPCQGCGANAVQTWRLCGRCKIEVSYCAECGGDDRAYAEMSAKIALEHGATTMQIVPPLPK